MNPARTRHCDRGRSPHAQQRLRSHWEAPPPGKARRVGPRARRPASDRTVPIRPRGKGWLACLAGSSAPSSERSPRRASWRPSHTPARRPRSRCAPRRPGRTLVDATITTTRTAVVGKDGNTAHSCTGTSVAGALEQATAGDWDASLVRRPRLRGRRDRRRESAGRLQRLLDAVGQRQIVDDRRLRHRAARRRRRARVPLHLHAGLLELHEPAARPAGGPSARWQGGREGHRCSRATATSTPVAGATVRGGEQPVRTAAERKRDGHAGRRPVDAARHAQPATFRPRRLHCHRGAHGAQLRQPTTEPRRRSR